MKKSVVLEHEDVSVKRLDPPRCECGKRATHAVWIDLRTIGVQHVVDEACKECAQKMADRIRDSVRKTS
jgi:hypothetical protein